MTPLLGISYTAARHSQRIPTCSKSCNSERRHKVRLRADVPLFALASSIMQKRLPEYQACLCMAIIMSCILAMLLDVFLHDAEDVDVKCT